MPTPSPPCPPRARRRALALATIAWLVTAPLATRADPPASQPAPDAVYARIAALPVEAATLANGLRVLVHEDHRTPVAFVMVRYRVGGRDDPRGRSGFAHLFEHLMFRGSRHVAPGTYWRTLEAAGASYVNATTSDDSTVYYETVPVGRLNLALWMESDRMAYLLDRLDRGAFEAEREVVLNEYRQSVENVAAGHVERWLTRALFPPAHPYHRDTLGEPAELRAASVDDVRAFFRRWYAPDNATLVVAGDVTPARVRALAEQYFGSIPPRAPGELPPPRPASPLPPPPRAAEARLLVEADVQAARVVIAWPVPAVREPDHGAVEALAGLLGHGTGSRLVRRLVHETRLATALTLEHSAGTLAGTLWLRATVAPGRTPEAVLAEIDAEIARLRAPDAPTLSAGEVARGRNAAVAPTVFLLDSVAWRGGLISWMEDATGHADGLSQVIASRAGATGAAMQACARRYLAPERRAVALVVPAAGAPVAGRVVRAVGVPAPE